MRKQTGIVQPLLLALLLAIGLGAVWAVLMAWGVHQAKQFCGAPRPFERMDFRADGTPVIERYEGNEFENVSYRTLDGQTLSISRREAWLGNSYLPNAQGAEYDVGLPWDGGFQWKKQISGYNDGGQPMTFWYFVADGKPPHGGYFVGFDSVGKQRIGYMGRNGFLPAVPSAEERFPWRHRQVTNSVLVSSQYEPPGREPIYAYWSPGPGHFPTQLVYALADDGVAEIDLLKRSVRVVLKESGFLSASHLIRAQSTPATTDSAAYLSQVKEYLAVRGNDRVWVLNATGKLESSFAIPKEVRDVRAFMFCLLSDSSAILDVPTGEFRSVTPQAAEQWRMMWIDTKGNILRQKDYRVERGGLADRMRFLPWDTTLAAPAPLAIAAVFTWLAPWMSLSLGEEPTYVSALGKSSAEFWPALLAVCLFGGLMAWLCYRRQTRYGLPWTKTWVTFVFLGGFPGLVAYHVHRRWPALKPCPSCGRPLPCDRDSCFSCGRELPAPVPKGIDVFA